MAKRVTSRSPTSATSEAGASRSASETGAQREIAVWDLPTRLFHWFAVLLVAGAYVTARLNWVSWHSRIGYVLLGLLLFRLLWGLCGSETARFSKFLSWPSTAFRHLMRALRRDADAEVGHNPAGGWMVMLLLALMLGQTLTGLYVGNDISDEGPLTEYVSAPAANLIEAMHDLIIWYALVIAVAIHVLAILAYLVVKRENLITPMVTGRKIVATSIRPPPIQRWPRALFILACSIVAAYALVELI